MLDLVSNSKIKNIRNIASHKSTGYQIAPHVLGTKMDLSSFVLRFWSGHEKIGRRTIDRTKNDMLDEGRQFRRRTTGQQKDDRLDKGRQVRQRTTGRTKNDTLVEGRKHFVKTSDLSSCVQYVFLRLTCCPSTDLSSFA